MSQYYYQVVEDFKFYLRKFTHGYWVSQTNVPGSKAPRHVSKSSCEVSEIQKVVLYMCVVVFLIRAGDVTITASCFWDSKNDGNFSKKYPFEDYYVIINVFGFARQ